jgi:hypothetical protein
MDQFTKLKSKILYESDLVEDCHQLSCYLYKNNFYKDMTQIKFFVPSNKELTH